MRSSLSAFHKGTPSQNSFGMQPPTMAGVDGAGLKYLFLYTTISRQLPATEFKQESPVIYF
jgi:hypothetical protein